MRLSCSVALLLASSLAAQSYTVSPAQFTNYRGNSSNTFPFSYPTGRYQQVHGDLKGSPKLLQGMTFRRAQSTSAARSMVLTINLGDSSYAARSSTFASNFTGTPVTVLPQSTVNFPDWTTSSGSVPEPWTAMIPFTTPFAYTGVNDFCWEFLIDGNSTTASRQTDAYTNTTTMFAALSPLGTGCIVGTNTLPMTQTMNVTTSSTTGNLSFGGSIARGPASAAAVMMVGVVNLDLTIAGLCEKLFPLTVWSFNINLGTTGSGSMTTLATPHNAAWAGAQVFSQTAALDANQPGLPVALSNGTAVTLPPFSPAPIDICRIYLNGSSSGTTGTLASNYGLTVRWTH